MKRYIVIQATAYGGDERVAVAVSGEQSDDVEIENLEKLVTQANQALALRAAVRLALEEIGRGPISAAKANRTLQNALKIIGE